MCTHTHVSLQPLSRNRDFVLLWTGQALSSLGGQMSAVAYPLLVLALTHSAAKAGIVGFAASVPYTLFVLPAGVFVDRWNRRRVMVAADLGRAAALGVLVVALATGRPSYLLVAAVAFVESTLFAFFNIAETGAVRQVVPAPQLPEAIARDGARIYGTIVAGPPLGGLLFGLSRLLPFLADAVSYSFSIVTLLAMRTPFQQERAEPRRRLREELREGFEALWGNAFLRSCALMFAASNGAGSGIFLATIVIARRQGFSPGEVGVLLSVIGAVGVLGSLAAPWLQRVLSVRSVVVGSQWVSVGLLAFVVHPDVWLLLVGYVPWALAVPTLNSVVIGYRIAITPDRLVGRVNSVARFVAQAVSPLGPLAAGLLLDAVSARTTIALFALWLMGLGIWTSLNGAIRNAPSLAELSERDLAPVP